MKNKDFQFPLHRIVIVCMIIRMLIIHLRMRQLWLGGGVGICWRILRIEVVHAVVNWCVRVLNWCWWLIKAIEVSFIVVVSVIVQYVWLVKIGIVIPICRLRRLRLMIHRLHMMWLVIIPDSSLRILKMRSKLKSRIACLCRNIYPWIVSRWIWCWCWWCIRWCRLNLFKLVRILLVDSVVHVFAVADVSRWLLRHRRSIEVLCVQHFIRRCRSVTKMMLLLLRLKVSHMIPRSGGNGGILMRMLLNRWNVVNFLCIRLWWHLRHLLQLLVVIVVVGYIARNISVYFWGRRCSSWWSRCSASVGIFMLHLTVSCLMPGAFVLLLTMVTIEHAILIWIFILALKMFRYQNKLTSIRPSSCAYLVHFLLMPRQAIFRLKWLLTRLTLVLLLSWKISL